MYTPDEGQSEVEGMVRSLHVTYIYYVLGLQINSDFGIGSKIHINFGIHIHTCMCYENVTEKLFT